MSMSTQKPGLRVSHTDRQGIVGLSDLRLDAVEFTCADCGCLVNRGVRERMCDDPECCCQNLPIAKPPKALRDSKWFDAPDP